MAFFLYPHSRTATQTTQTVQSLSAGPVRAEVATPSRFAAQAPGPLRWLSQAWRWLWDLEAPAPKPAPSTVLPTTDPKAAAPAIHVQETPVQKAQRRYAPLETSYRGKMNEQGRGNLLKLAK